MLSSPELEKRIIGSLIFEAPNDAKASCMTLIEEDFTDAKLKLVLRAAQELYVADKKIDLVSVSDKLTGIGGIITLLTECLKSSFSASINQMDINRLKTHTSRRKLREIGREIIESAMDRALEPIEIVRETSKKFDELSTGGVSEDESIKKIMFEALNYIGEKSAGKNMGMHIGISDFDNITGGLFNGELTVIGARPGVGKSAFAQLIAVRCAEQGCIVEFFSREMSQLQYGVRLLSQFSMVNGRKMRTGRDLGTADFKAIASGVAKNAALPLFINTKARTVAEIFAVCYERKRNEGLGMVVVDYLQLLSGSGKHKDRVQEMSEVSRGLKELALEFNIPVVALSQLNRDATNKQPTMANLRESGAIEQDADNIILLHELERVEEGAENFRITRLIIEKQRQGETGYIDMVFRPATMQFTPLEYKRV